MDLANGHNYQGAAEEREPTDEPTMLKSPARSPEAEDAFGGVDILVNNAVDPVRRLDRVKFPVEKWNAILAINLSSAFHTTRLQSPG